MNSSQNNFINGDPTKNCKKCNNVYSRNNSILLYYTIIYYSIIILYIDYIIINVYYRKLETFLSYDLGFLQKQIPDMDMGTIKIFGMWSLNAASGEVGECDRAGGTHTYTVVI